METNSGNKKKAKHLFSREEAVEYLRRLADQLENGAIQISNEEMEFEGLIKVKESLKSKKGKTSVKVQFKVSTEEMPPAEEEGAAPEAKADEAGPEAEPEKDQHPSYKKLKKAMGKLFKAMGEALDKDAEVSPADIAAFCDQAMQMTTYKDEDKGQAAYPEFEAAVQAFRAAGESGEAAAVKKAYDELEARKKACHKEFK